MRYLTGSDSGQSLPPAPADGLAKWILFSQVLGATLLQKFALPISGDTKIFLSLPIMLAGMGIGLLCGRLEFKGMRLGLYLLMAGGIILTQLLGAHGSSVSSIALLLIIHLPYACSLRKGFAPPGAELRFLQNIMVVLAVLGILQFGLQFVIGSKYAFILDTAFPQAFIMEGFHQLNPMQYGSTTYKSNGIFFLEPAVFCQILAVSVIIEMIYFKRARYLLLFACGLLATFSGTGLIILGVLVPVFLIKNRYYKVLATLLLLFVLAIGFSPFLGLENQINRVNEFGDERSSGFARFVSIFIMLYDYILPNSDTLLFGMGAGSIKSIGGQLTYSAYDPSWGKVVFEYGLLGTLAYAPLMIYMIYTAPRSPYIKAALMIQFLFLGEYILTPMAHCLILALLAWPAEDLNFLLKEGAEEGTVRNV